MVGWLVGWSVGWSVGWFCLVERILEYDESIREFIIEKRREVFDLLNWILIFL